MKVGYLDLSHFVETVAEVTGVEKRAVPTLLTARPCVWLGQANKRYKVD